MAYETIQVECYNITVANKIADASKLISTVVAAGVDFHAFKVIPVSTNQTQFTFFAKDSLKLTEDAKKEELKLDGTYSALLIKGNEEAGALGSIYSKLSNADIQIKEAYGIAGISRVTE